MKKNCVCFGIVLEAFRTVRYRFLCWSIGIFAVLLSWLDIPYRCFFNEWAHRIAQDEDDRLDRGE